MQRYIVLVYQAGIANVFEVTGKIPNNPQRLLQSDFRTCEAFARGMGTMGARVVSLACNQAGNIADRVWSDDLENQPFSDSFRPVRMN